MALITEDEVRRLVNNLADGKAKGVDGRAQIPFQNTYQRAYGHSQQGLHPIIALIAKEGAQNEGQLKPIAILPYI
eukprot:14749040-Heterocapsa_arctica.AAC.1